MITSPPPPPPSYPRERTGKKALHVTDMSISGLSLVGVGDSREGSPVELARQVSPSSSPAITNEDFLYATPYTHAPSKSNEHGNETDISSKNNIADNITDNCSDNYSDSHESTSTDTRGRVSN